MDLSALLSVPECVTLFAVLTPMCAFVCVHVRVRHCDYRSLARCPPGLPAPRPTAGSLGPLGADEKL